MSSLYSFKLPLFANKNLLKKKFIIAFSLLTLVFQYSFTQENILSERHFKAVILDKTSRETIPNVNIFNESQRKWNISKVDGTCNIQVHKGDTLAITMIGYLGSVVVVNETVPESGITLLLAPRTYDIEEVRVFGYRNYSDFQKAFVDLDIPKTKTDELREYLNTAGKQEAIGAAYDKQVSEKLNNPGFGISLGRASKDLRKELDRIEQMQYTVDKKFNRKIIFELTKLPEDELTSFIGYCNFSLDYLYNATEYDIVCAIMRKYALYKVLKDSTGEFYFMGKKELNLS